MIKSKAWDWSKNEDNHWLVPSIESCYLVESWKSKGFNKFLDLGCGLGRHSIYFAQKGFDVNSIDLSDYGVNHLKKWADNAQLNINVPHFYMDIEDIKNNFIDFDFIKMPIEQAGYNMENSKSFSKHFNLIVRKK